MRPIKRRHFLQSTASLLATLGLSQLDIQTAGERYARVLAQGIPRKLALLVGINAYPETGDYSPLNGCVTDVELQRQLLIHRFGFNPNDILTLTDQQATRQGILTAFEEHLIKQAKAGDVVVFHFSGHGSRVKDPDCEFPSDCFMGILVPVDSGLSTESPNQKSLSVSDNKQLVQDITKSTLDTLLNALQTEYVTVVLDTVYAGNFAGKNGFTKGVLLPSAKRDQLAVDAPFDGFHAGVFTYLMTQYLWQQTSNKSFASMMFDVSRLVTRSSFSEQEPVLSVKSGSGYENRPVYFSELKTPPAEAVITNVNGDQAELWLGGINSSSLAAFKAGAVLSVVDAQGRQKGRVRLESRNGLVGIAKLLDTAPLPGDLLQERTRNIPTNLTLKIGLDPSLDNETAAAKTALQALNRIEAIPSKVEATPSQTRKVTYLQEVNYILSRMTAEYHTELQQGQVAAELPAIGSLGLFSRGRVWIPSSFGSPDETVTGAVRRLQPKFKLLLAAQLIRVVLNAESSQLNVAVSLRLEEEDNVVASASTTRGGTRGSASQSAMSNFNKIPVGEPIQLQIANNESRNFYFTVLIVDPAGQMLVIFPNSWDTPEEATLVSAGQTLRIPDPDRDNFALMTQPPKGVVEVLMIASATPLGQGLKALRSIALEKGLQSGPINLDVDPLRVIDSFLNDFDEGSRSPSPRNKGAVPMSIEQRTVSTSQLAVISITFEII